MGKEDIKEKISELSNHIDFNIRRINEKGDNIVKGKFNTLSINNVETFKIKKEVSNKFKNILNSVEYESDNIDITNKILSSSKYNISEIKDVNLKECLLNIQSLIEKIKNRMN